MKNRKIGCVSVVRKGPKPKYLILVRYKIKRYKIYGVTAFGILSTILASISRRKRKRKMSWRQTR